jgi:hypothetical protein
MSVAVVAAAALALTGCGGGSSKPAPPPAASSHTATAVPASPTAPVTPSAPSTSYTTPEPGMADLSNDPGCNEAMNALLSAGKLPKDDPLKAATGLSAILDKLSDAAAKTKRPGAADVINKLIADIRAGIKDSSQDRTADQTKLAGDANDLANVCFG